MSATFEIGDLPIVVALFTDVEGTPTNPTTVVFKTRTPTGTITTYTSPDASIVNGEVGEWTFTFPAALSIPGTWYVRAAGTSGLISAEEVGFEVSPSRF
jgi:hypothetical protein